MLSKTIASCKVPGRVARRGKQPLALSIAASPSIKAFHFCAILATVFAPLASTSGRAQPVAETVVQETDFVALADRAYQLHVDQRNAEAIETLNRAEQEGLSGPQPNTIEVANAWNHLGMILFNLEYNERSKNAYEKALGIAKTSAAPDPFMSDLFNNLGQVETRLGHPKEAIDDLQTSLTLLQKSPDTKPHWLAVRMDNLGLAHDMAGDLKEGEEFHQKALDFFENEAGFVSPDAATAAANLGDVYRRKHDYPRAEAYLLRALDTHQRLSGSAHEATLRDMASLAYLYLSMGNQERMERLVNLLLGTGGTAPGKEHVAAATYEVDLADDAVRFGQLAVAERLSARGREIFRVALGDDDDKTLWATGVLADIQLKKGDLQSADESFRTLLKAYGDKENSRAKANTAVALAKV
jgi:tetratricopeptide (TPR) repeat protein